MTRVSLIIVSLWMVGFYSVVLFGMSLPEQKTASFFTAGLVAEPRGFDFFSLFIPSNPFQSVAENKVPAVVLFCLLCGAALIGLKNKDRVIGAIDTLLDILGRVTGFVVNLSPYGVFLIAASAAGTMNIAELARIQGYIVMLTILCLAICFLLIPLVISAFTPFRNKRYLAAAACCVRASLRDRKNTGRIADAHPGRPGDLPQQRHGFGGGAIDDRRTRPAGLLVSPSRQDHGDGLCPHSRPGTSGHR